MLAVPCYIAAGEPISKEKKKWKYDMCTIAYVSVLKCGPLCTHIQYAHTQTLIYKCWYTQTHCKKLQIHIYIHIYVYLHKNTQTRPPTAEAYLHLHLCKQTNSSTYTFIHSFIPYKAHFTQTSSHLLTYSVTIIVI